MRPEETFEVASQKVLPIIKSIGEKDSAYATHLNDAIFVIPTPSLLSRVVAGINDLPQVTSGEREVDTLGDLYEYLLSKLQSSGTNGQFRTPGQIIDMIVELMKPTPEDIIVDPAAGTAGFLVSASQYLRKNHNDMFFVHGIRDNFKHVMYKWLSNDKTMHRSDA